MDTARMVVALGVAAWATAMEEAWEKWLRFASVSRDGRASEPLQASSRNAFAGIESLVSAVVNIAQMLESTYEAMFSSFR